MSDGSDDEHFEDAVEDDNGVSSSANQGADNNLTLSELARQHNVSSSLPGGAGAGAAEDGHDESPEDAAAVAAALAHFDPATAFVGSRFEGMGIADDVIIQETKRGEDLFLTNQFEEARKLFEPHALRSMYHALGYSTVLAVRAVMTMEQDDIQAAFRQLKITVAIAGKYRRRESLMASVGKMLKGGGGAADRLASLTKDELHAELTYAESTLMKAEISFFAEEGIMAFIKGGLALRNAYNTYRNCLKFVQKLERDGRLRDSPTANSHFVSGVYFGMGTFNLVTSLFPAKLMRLFEFVGFSTDREQALKLLEQGGALEGSLRGPLCDLSLLIFHSVLRAMLDLPDCDLDRATAILNKNLKLFPDGAIFLFFEGKINQGRKLLRTAIESYNRAIKAELVWKQLHHLCFWELCWNHALLLEWDKAAGFAGQLYEESKWSRTFYAYQQAAFLIAGGRPEDAGRVKELLESVPKNKQKIAGKSIPIEKFVIRKARQYFKQNNFLLLPALEILYMWGYLNLIGETREDMLALTERALADATARPDYDNKVDDIGLCRILRGCLKREEGDIDAAEEDFLAILESEKRIHLDHYLAPFARVELARLYIDMKRDDEARQQLDLARTKYKRYSMESKLSFRLHLLTAEIEQRGGGA